MKSVKIKKGFTLVEMLVVVGILGILIAVLMGAMSGSTESAQAAKCLANMKNLASAAQSYGLAHGHYPHAGSIEKMGIDKSQGMRNIRKKVSELPGWVSWSSKGLYPAENKQSPATIGMFTSDDDEALFAITNGALWKYVGGNSSMYVCPLHAKKAKPRWSYLMNAYFGWSAEEGYAYSSQHGGIEYGKFGAADRTLLFSEVPFQGAGDWFPDGDASMDTDGILQYKGCNKSPAIAGKSRRDGNEHIGANHKSGKYWMAHLVYADGHVEKLRMSTSAGQPIDGENLRDVTTWLCTGKAFSLTGNKYEEVK